MPTENRSSNTEMVSVPEGYMLVERSIWTEQQVEAATACITRLKGVPTMNDRALAMAAIDAAQCTAPDIALSDLLPAPQPHPEPIAWMVGTAFWWTKEEAERDAAATGLPIVGLGPTTDAAEVERLEYRIKTQRESIRSHVQEVDRLRVAEIKYGLKIEERNALLRKCLEWITSARDGVLYPIARDFEGVVGRNAEGLGQATPDLIDAVNDALSASAEPEAKS